MVWFNPARRMFDKCYQATPPWDLGHPKQQFVDLFLAGAVAGSVLDIGCGTGDLALFFAGHGLETWGIDFSSAAIHKAEQKAQEQHIPVTFRVQNALLLGDLGRKFDTATDCGCFHTFDKRERPAYAKSLDAVLRPGGRFFLLCTCDQEPAGNGRRRISQQEIRSCFRDGWTIESIEPTVFESNRPGGGARGWLAAITKNG